MSHHDPMVVVLGAGYSSAAGHPLMAEFATVVTQLANDRESGLRENERIRFKKVLDYRSQMQRLYAYLNLDLDNLEHLFSLIDMEASLSPQAVNQATELQEDLVFVLVKTLELTLKKPGGEPAADFASYKSSGQLSLVR